MAYFCGAQGVCVLRFNSAIKQYQPLFTAPPLLGLVACEFKFNLRSQNQILVIGFCTLSIVLVIRCAFFRADYFHFDSLCAQLMPQAIVNGA
jgi:hypothetical protein